MAIVSALCTSFKQELLAGLHDFTPLTGNVFKAALYWDTAALDATVLAYTLGGEISGPGYLAGGLALTTLASSAANAVAWISFNDAVWTNASFTARGALIYNATRDRRAVCVLDFGMDRTVWNGVFTLAFPANDSANAIIRLA